MKKNILLVLITAIICITGTVIASNYLASEIVYNDTTVEGALDELYNIHETYKNLTTATDFTASDLVNGKKAYNSNGELITGTNTKNGVNDSISIPSNFSNTYYEYNCGFRPTFIYFSWSNSYYWTFINNSLYTDRIDIGGSFSNVTNKNWLVITDTGFKLNVDNLPGLKGLSANIYVYE